MPMMCRRPSIRDNRIQIALTAAIPLGRLRMPALALALIQGRGLLAGTRLAASGNRNVAVDIRSFLASWQLSTQGGAYFSLAAAGRAGKHRRRRFHLVGPRRSAAHVAVGAAD